MTGQHPVLVAGAGPTGLVAALLLARQGVPVRVFEAANAPMADQRGAAFHPPTLEILDGLGLTDALHEIGLIVPRWQVRDREEGIVADFDLGLLRDDTRFPYRFHLGQHLLVPVLIDALSALPNASLEFASPVTGLSQHADGVDAVIADGERVRGSFLIGADGGRSRVRTLVGVTMEGFTWPERFVVMNVAADLATRGLALTNYIANGRSWAVVLRLSDAEGGRLWRVTSPADAEPADQELLAPDALRQRLYDCLLGDIGVAPSYAGIYRVHQRVANTFRVGRVLLAGDAAHLNNPLGGFGLNSGVHDAANLAERLVPRWRGEADDGLLDQYVRQRHHANTSFVQQSSIRNKQLLEESDPAVRKQSYAALRKVAADPVLARDHLLRTSMIASVREAAQIN